MLSYKVLRCARCQTTVTQRERVRERKSRSLPGEAAPDKKKWTLASRAEITHAKGLAQGRPALGFE